MGKTTWGFMLGFATACGVAYLTYRALLAIPEMEEAPPERAVERVRRAH